MRLLDLQTDSHPDALGEARRQVSNAMLRAGVAGDVASDTEIAVGEALSNVYRHAYREKIGPVRIELSLSASFLTAVIHDDGCGVIVPSIPTAPPTSPAEGGRGLYLMSRLTDDLTIHVNASGHGVTICMKKWLDRATSRHVRTPRRTRY